MMHLAVEAELDVENSPEDIPARSPEEPESRHSIRTPCLGTAGLVSVCVVCCSEARTRDDTVHQVKRALAPVAQVSAMRLSELLGTATDANDVVAVPRGTKLSKLLHIAQRVTADLVCICDPDLHIRPDACRLVCRRAIAEHAAGREVVAFGIVEGEENGTILSRVVGIDKWISHYVLRPSLWSLGLGITVPGQFLIVSTSLLRSLVPSVNTFLDDLYIGAVARMRRASVVRVPLIVGTEESRAGWGSLLTQRIRWMRGLVSLFAHLRSQPPAIGLLAIHYVAYHGLPVVFALGTAVLARGSPLAALLLLATVAVILARSSGRPLAAAIVFLAIFPIVHAVATLFWWFPIRPALLMRR